MANDLNVIERKVLGALIMLSDTEGNVTTNMSQIARKIGYKTSGGVLGLCLKSLALQNLINFEHTGEVVSNQRKIKVKVHV